MDEQSFKKVKQAEAKLKPDLAWLIKEYGSCQQCGWCCVNERFTLPLTDRRFEKLKKAEPERFEHGTESIHVLGVTFKLPCPFLDEHKRCVVYDIRSDICRYYPFLFRYEYILTIADDCPLGEKIIADVVAFGEARGVKVTNKNEAENLAEKQSMDRIDKMCTELGMRSGDGYESRVLNVPYVIMHEFIKHKRWAKKMRK